MRSTATWLSGLVLVAAPAAQSFPVLAAGHDSEVRFAETGNPASFRAVAVAASGLVYAAIDNQVVEVDALGQSTVLHQFTNYAWAELIEVEGDELFFVESASTNAWRRHLVTGAQTAGSVPFQTFDLLRAPGGALLASANPGWPTPGAQTGIWQVDFAGGNHREVIALQGPSGPMAFSAGGDLYCAVLGYTIPPPTGSVSVIRFDGPRLLAALQGGPALSISDGTTVLTGLDGAYSMAFDDRGRLHWSDPLLGGVERTAPGVGAREPTPLLARPTPPETTVALRIQFVDEGPATFDPYQPDSGGSMFVFVTDWFQRAELLRLRPRRPVVISSPTASAAPGPVTFFLSGLPPSGSGWLCATAMPPIPEQKLFEVQGTPFWSGLDLRVWPICIPVQVDGAGNASIAFEHTGGAGLVHFQAIGIDASSWPFGTSSIYSLTLRP